MLRGRVKDSNLGRRTPTDLQSAPYVLTDATRLRLTKHDADQRRVTFARQRRPHDYQSQRLCPRRAGRPPGWPATTPSPAGPGGRVWHPPASLKGYRTSARGRLHHARTGPVEGAPGRRAVGLRQADGMPHEPNAEDYRRSPRPVGESGREAPDTESAGSGFESLAAHLDLPAIIVL